MKRGRLDSHYSCFVAVTGSRPPVAGNRGAASAISGEWQPLACGLHRNFGIWQHARNQKHVKERGNPTLKETDVAETTPQNKHYNKNACSHKLVCVTHKTVYRNNQALQAASREPGARIVSVILKQCTEQSSFTKSQQGVHCMDCECQSPRNLQNTQALQAAN
jgi:hypothetical protein